MPIGLFFLLFSIKSKLFSSNSLLLLRLNELVLSVRKPISKGMTVSAL